MSGVNYNDTTNKAGNSSQLATKATRPTFSSVSLASDVNVTSATFVNVTALVLVLTTPTGGETIQLSLSGSSICQGTTGTIIIAYNINGGSDITVATTSLQNGFGGSINFSVPVSLAAGSNTIQIRARRNGGSSFDIEGNSTFGFTTLTAVQYG